MPVSFYVTMVAAGLLLAQMFWLGSLGKPGPELSKEEMRRHSIGLLFYVNPDDPRGWVPKLWGFGWTVNMRNKGQVAIFAALVVISLVSALWMTVTVT